MSVTVSDLMVIIGYYMLTREEMHLLLLSMVLSTLGSPQYPWHTINLLHIHKHLYIPWV